MKLRTFSYQITGVEYNSVFNPAEHLMPKIKLTRIQIFTRLLFVFTVLYFTWGVFLR